MPEQDGVLEALGGRRHLPGSGGRLLQGFVAEGLGIDWRRPVLRRVEMGRPDAMWELRKYDLGELDPVGLLAVLAALRLLLLLLLLWLLLRLLLFLLLWLLLVRLGGWRAWHRPEVVLANKFVQENGKGQPQKDGQDKACPSRENACADGEAS